MMGMANLAHSDETQCKDVLSKCDAALHAQLDLNITQNKIIDDQAALIQILNTQIADASLWKPLAIGAAAVVILETAIIMLRK